MHFHFVQSFNKIGEWNNGKNVFRAFRNENKIIGLIQKQKKNFFRLAKLR